MASVSEVALQEAVELLLGNPFALTVRQKRRELQNAGALPDEHADEEGWRRWWSALPPALRNDEAAGIAVCVGFARGRTGTTELGPVARILPKQMRERVAEMAARAMAVREALEKIVGDSETMRRVRQQTWSAAFGLQLMQVGGLAAFIRTTPVLIRGETGTGKEMVARALSRSTPGTWREGQGWTPGPYEAVHLGSLPETLVHDALFGHIKGAFTGALDQQPGVLERCHEGMVFLDEVAEMPAHTQVCLLRTLEERTARRLGDKVDRPAAPRVVSATHRDLATQIRDGDFREDLYHRLSSVVIEIPPLRERPADVALIAEGEINKVDASVRWWLRDRFEEFERCHADYSWPGNVRELTSVLRALALGLEPRLTSPVPAVEGPDVPPEIVEARWPLAEVQRWYAARAVERHGTQVQAAKALGVHRGTLREYLRGRRS